MKTHNNVLQPTPRSGAAEFYRYVVNDKFKPIMVINMKYIIAREYRVLRYFNAA